MASPVNHWKLGFFVLVVAAAAVVALIGAGECSNHHPTIAFYTYFDESVGGVVSGGRVEFRGVDVGAISAISIAPDHRDISVKYDLDLGSLAKMGITVTKQGHRVRSDVPSDLRAHVGGNGLTGVKYLAIDVVDPQESRRLSCRSRCLRPTSRLQPAPSGAWRTP